MNAPTPTAPDVVAALYVRRTESELVKVRKRLAPDEPAIGMRMGDLFAAAKSFAGLPLDEVDRLLDEREYEARMAAMCILDFQAQQRLTDAERDDRRDLYVRRHDRITTWDMVDRAAPRVVGRALLGRPLTLLHDLARARDPLRRRTAITAPLWFVRAGSDEDVADGLTIAGWLAADDDPVVYNAVGIYLKHAGSRDAEAVCRFLDGHAAFMHRPAVRLAVDKLDPVSRRRYVR